MSLPEIKNEIDEIKKTVEEILSLLKQVSTDSDEAIAAKIINVLKEEINKNNKEILEALGKSNDELVLRTKKDEESSTTTGLSRYSWPNYMVGNEELGSSGDPDALMWPSMKPRIKKEQ